MANSIERLKEYWAAYYGVTLWLSTCLYLYLKDTIGIGFICLIIGSLIIAIISHWSYKENQFFK
jgi:hypothetical protein